MTDMAGQRFILRWSGHELDLGRKTYVMGVINVTPDSFSDGGLFFDRDRAVEHALTMVGDGVDVIDVGGESTRPYAEEVSVQEELDRVIPVIQRLSGAVGVPISIDTLKAKVAKEALAAGASIINDISALRFDPEMMAVAARAKVPVILMHMKGTPGTMQDHPTYGDLIQEIGLFLEDAMERAVEAGIDRNLILLDPGIGFGKSFDHNLKILKDLGRFQTLGRPLLIGSSNKAFIGHILKREPDQRDTGTMATVAAAAMNGAHMVRVHNVAKAVETVKIIDAVKRGCVQ